MLVKEFNKLAENRKQIKIWQKVQKKRKTFLHEITYVYHKPKLHVTVIYRKINYMLSNDRIYVLGNECDRSRS